LHISISTVGISTVSIRIDGTDSKYHGQYFLTDGFVFYDRSFIF
jgi:hypothetical protein